MRNTPWYHQRRSESAPPVERIRDPPSITLQEQENMITRLSRPTESARYRRSLFWKLDGYMEKGFHSWSKMELFEDSKQCMWTNQGSIKKSCKIRPLHKVLPPLKSGGRESHSSTDTHRKSGEASALSCIRSADTGTVGTIQGSRCDSRRAVLRPQPSMGRSSTSVNLRHPPSGRSFSLHGLSNGGACTGVAVPRMNVASVPQTTLVGH